MWKFIVDVVHDFVSSLQPDVGRGFLHVSNVFLFVMGSGPLACEFPRAQANFGGSLHRNTLQIVQFWGDLWDLRQYFTRALFDFQGPGSLSSGPPRTLTEYQESWDDLWGVCYEYFAKIYYGYKTWAYLCVNWWPYFVKWSYWMISMPQKPWYKTLMIYDQLMWMVWLNSLNWEYWARTITIHWVGKFYWCAVLFFVTLSRHWHRRVL